MRAEKGVKIGWIWSVGKAKKYLNDHFRMLQWNLKDIF